MERTTPLTPEGVREIINELSHPPADTPERRRTLEGVRRWREHRRRFPIVEDWTGE